MTTFNWQSFGAAPVAAPGAPMVPMNFDLSKLDFGQSFDGSGISSALSGFGGAGMDFQPPSPTGGWFDKVGGLEGMGKLAQGLMSLGSLYGSFKGLGLAKDQLNFTKQAFQENLANSKKSYNTALEDRIVARNHAQGGPKSAVQGYLDKHSL